VNANFAAVDRKFAQLNAGQEKITELLGKHLEKAVTSEPTR
jgi:hypothetical protein